MDMLGNVLGSLKGGGQGGGLAGAVMQLLIHKGGSSGQGGSTGLAGLIQTMNSNGLGDVVSSWVGTGQNKAISAAQLSSVLGKNQIA
ncbi:MAG: hypothetical protein EXQ56_01595 [Acidobacteria bacterium]|nr:hypothetical protein [Acidobacteriota bacterium]